MNETNSTLPTKTGDVAISPSHGYASVLCGMLFLFSIVLAVRNVPRNGGRNIWCQLGYLAAVGALAYIIPTNYALDLFDPISITLICTVYPIYESIVAVCTVETDDDTTWLQYWIAQGILEFASEWVNDATRNHPVTRSYWFGFKFFYYVWLLLPFTDGAALLYDFVTEPLIVPIIAPSSRKFGSWLTLVVTTIINAVHLWFIWFAFFFLDPHIKNFLTIVIGTAYPIMASMVAVSTPQGHDDTYWLTYWICFGLLYLIMGMLKQYLEHIPGFYAIYIFITLYLMLPLFQGADKVFRNVIVPLAGKTEMLLLRDALMLRVDVEEKMPSNRHESVRKKIAETFQQPTLPVSTTRRKRNYKSSDGYQEIQQNVV